MRHRHSKSIQNANPPRPVRRAFTLLELLVAISILMVLSALTFTMVNVTMDQDRIGGGSREVQSFLEGARNQAVYAKAPRGVRFLLSPDDPTTVSSMIYIGPPSSYTSGSIDIEKIEDPPASSTFYYRIIVSASHPNVATEWVNLYQRQLLINGARIKIPNEDNGVWYTISQRDFGGTLYWTLTSKYGPLELAMLPASDIGRTYKLELSPAVLPNQEPRLLARNVFIDLDNS
ncbi:MAG: Tfp pilus assembly protein FimT/FimU, partial [Planctomycetaceae bacterium]